ncbi:MAG TPA: hypothetical protein VIY29_16445, partial [Ktedonobacteraceae bacterium]
VLHFIHELSEAGADLRQLNMQVAEYWRALMLTKAGADIAAILDRSEGEVSEIRQTAQLFELEELTEAARIFAQNELMQKGQGTPQLGLELAFLQSIELHRRSHQAQFSSATPASMAPMTADPALHSRSAQARSAASAAPQVVPPAPVVPETALSVDNKDAPGTENKPALTLQQVRDGWDNVKKRVRPKNPKTAAMLNGFTVVGVEGTVEEAVVIIQAAYELHHKYVQEGERAKDVDWALSTEFKQKCRARLLAPGASLPASLVFEPSSFSLNVAAHEAPAQAARRERPASNAKPSVTEPEGRFELPLEASAANLHTSAVGQPAEVAKKNIVREHTATGSTLETIKQQASSDPVVQEVIRTFAAKIVDVRLK